MNRLPNLYLIGFMGTGKTLLGHRVAKRLHMRFIDSDEEIEKAKGMSVSKIFETVGEAEFRKMEMDFIESGHPDSGCVVSCGGGLVCNDAMPPIIRKKGVCIVLFSDPNTILKRVSGNSSRPLLNVENPLEKIKSMLAQRSPYYMKSGIAINAGENAKLTEDHIIRIYNSNKRHFISKKTDPRFSVQVSDNLKKS